VKTYLLLAFIAALSNGREPDFGTGKPVKTFPPVTCLYFGGEGNLEDTVRLRLELLGADLTRTKI
jgi:hypothetical protein